MTASSPIIQGIMETTASWCYQSNVTFGNNGTNITSSLIGLFGGTNYTYTSPSTTLAQESRLTFDETQIVHSIAVGSLGVSLLFSFGTLAYMVCTGPSLYRRKMAERLVFYLALCDLCYSTEHIIDHTYLLVHHSFPTDPYCTTLAFFLQEFATMQGIIVVFTAVNAFAFIVREKGLSTGRYDWRLLVTSLGLPVLQGAVCVPLGAFGPSEAWCFTDKRLSWTVYVDLYYAATFVVVFLVDIVCYGLVFYKIHKISRLLKQVSSESGHNRPDQRRSTVRSARTMCVFVLAYLFQWFGYMAYSLWSLASPPPVALLALTVLVTNMGGTYNCVAYTLVRKIGAGSKGRGTSRRNNNTDTSQQSLASLNSTVQRNSSGQSQVGLANGKTKQSLANSQSQLTLNSISAIVQQDKNAI